MLIILEGPDGAGKTTLAERLVTQLAVKYPRDQVELIHRGPPTRAHPLDEYVVPLLDYRPGGGRHLVLDRWHWGERVYPLTRNRQTKMDDAVFRYVEAFIHGRGGVTYHMNAPFSVIAGRLLTRGEDVDLNELMAEWQLFKEVAAVSLTGTTRVNRTPDGVIWHAEGRERRATLRDEFVTLVGNHNCEVLVVGDVRGCDGVDCKHGVTHSGAGTAFMPYPATSGHFLMGAFDGVSLHEWAFANACDVDDPALLWKELDYPSVITLGVNACRKFDRLKIRHAAAPHPQFIRRFHHRAVAEYGKLIRSLVGTERNELKWRP